LQENSIFCIDIILENFMRQRIAYGANMHEKNVFTEIFKNLVKYKWSENNFVGPSK